MPLYSELVGQVVHQGAVNLYTHHLNALEKNVQSCTSKIFFFLFFFLIHSLY